VIDFIGAYDLLVSGIGLMNTKFETIYSNFLIVTIFAHNLTAMMHFLFGVIWANKGESEFRIRNPSLIIFY
jgi:hypothetical protein